MRGDLGSLYDAHADRLYAYCWSLVGDQLAAAAVGDTFSAAVHQPPRGDSVLWLYALSRTACADRGAFTGEIAAQGGMLFADSDPLLRAAAGLRPDHREVLLLWAGEWLEPHDIARVLGIAPDTVVQLLGAARTRLERAVLDILMRGATEPQLDLISAFEKGRLPQLLARRAPATAPGWLRDRVLAACEEEATRPLPSVAAPSPLVVIGAERRERPKRGISGGISKGFGAAAGVAASAAAVIGLLVSWPAAKGGGGATSLVPTASNGQTNPASATTSGVPRQPPPGLTGSERAKGGSPSASENPVTSAYDGGPRQAGGTPGGAAPAPTSPAGRPAPEKKPTTDTPSRPEQPSTTPEQPATPPSTPPATPSDPATPPDDGSTPPTTPPTDTPSTPPSDGSGSPGPSPTANPAPEPGQG